ncbi:MAG: glycine--tRNA ligase [Proteobacteria bacterium]|nr:glycine--tRNA ligase [Pseudomonadota bacterium]
MEKITSLCKRRGFIFQSSEIYGGIQGFWDYGPLGAELKRNVKESWWTTMTRMRDDVVGLEATIIMHPAIWRASGHVDTFSDPMCDCLLTKKRFRADQVEPQDGTIQQYAGALDEGWKEAWQQLIGQEPQLEHGMISSKDATRLIETFHSTRITTAIPSWYDSSPFPVLLADGKHPESAVKLAKQFYSGRRLKDPTLVFGGTEKVVGTTRFNPENGAPLTPPVPFNLMFKTYVGPTATEADVAYLRPETAQAIFAQFKNVHETSRQKVPFGIAQMGKAFRNEVTPRNYTFRSREFEQMELEFFIKPDEAVEAAAGSIATPASKGHPGEPQPNWGWQMWHQYWVEERIKFYEGIGLPRTTLEEYWQKPEELAHYARACVDILFKFPFGTQELEGIAARSDFDLSQHERCSGKAMGIFDEELRTAFGKLPPEKQTELKDRYYAARLKYLTKMGVPVTEAGAAAQEDADGLAKGQYIPHVIEPSAGVDRLILALLANAFTEVTETDAKGKSETRVVMKFHPRIAPIKVAVLPLLKNKPELAAKARAIFESLRPHMMAFHDEAGSIGRRYARQDEAGTPFCVTVDFETFEGIKDGPQAGVKDTVTIRHRDDGKQERIATGDLLPWLLARVK